MKSEGGPLKVFLSYRSVDAPAVEAFATRLLGAGLDAWFDRWEMTAGDDIVAKMDAGVDGCHAALIFLSEAWFDGRWAQDEYTSLALRKVEDGIRLIPIMLGDVGARLPSRLRKLARRGVADFESICDALLGVDRKPGLATALRATTRAVDVVVEAHDDGRMSAALVVDGELRASAQGGRAPSGWDLGEAGSPGLLAEVGRRVGAAVFPPPVGAEVDQLLDGLGATVVVDLRIRADDSVVALPFETALLPSGRAAVLHPAVRMWRARHGPDGEVAVVVPRPAPGPLKILVAVGVPDEGQTPNVPLDVEAEMGSILDAVAEAVRDERAQVRVLEATDRAAIAKALAADDYHVLHLSGHGNEDCVEMADEDGVAVSVSAADLVESFQASGKVMPLVFVSSCRGGRTATGLAFRLHREGVSRVVAMQAPVSDGYATELATAFYRHLSRAPWPRAGVALAAARRDVEAAGRIDATRAQRPEWATATLLLTGEDVPLLDTDLPQVNLTRPPVHTVNGPVPAVEVRDLIGRRRELRTTLRALLGNPRFTAEHGEVGGVALTGTGGVGKSTVAGRAMARLAEAGWVCVATQGAVSLAAICRALAAELSESRQKWAGGLAEQLGQVPDDDDARLAFLERALRRDPLLLVLDNFEDNLTTGGGGFIDEARSALCEQLLNACAHGKLLFTCRHPLPGMMDAVHEVRVGPLSAAETRRLFLRLDGLKRLGPDDVQLVRSLVGGHPRVLEFLDALMRRGAAVDRVRPKLRALAREEGIDPRADRDVAAAVSDAVRLGARDILLDELLGALDDQERSVLLQVAVSGLPVAPDDLVVADRDGELSLDAVIEAAGRLVDLSLLVAVDGELWVHRWTAEALRGRQAEDEYRGRCRRAGEMRVRRLGSASRDVAEGIEAVENFVAADAFDEATAIGVRVANFLASTSTRTLAGFAARLRAALPTDHPNYKLVADHEATALVALGFTGAAIGRYVELVRDHERLAQAEPDRADYQRDMSVLYNRLGDLMTAAGQGEEAARLYRQSLDIARRLAEAEPDRADYQRDLSVSYNRLGLLAIQQGDIDAGRGYLEQDLAIARQLAELEPGSATNAVDVALSLRALSDIDPDRERTLLGEAETILASLQAQERLPPNAEALLGKVRTRLAE